MQCDDQFGDDFVGAGEIDQADPGEVEQGLGAIVLAEGGHQPVTDGRPGGTRDQVAICVAGGLAEDGIQRNDPVCHVASLPGTSSVTWAPGNQASPVVIGGASSHGGTIATRAVPLRIAILPCQRAR
jgi:hypothetical protein